eukprot:c12112_g1_i1.p1 GENE.c12112_g1_i1~~c12112_g1_i1.p1  ORF type:complete len:412 (+),score=70.04 c12112_g1_i1:147-1238(+)
MIVHTDKLAQVLDTSPCEPLVAIQLGGSNPETMATAASMAEQHGGYCEVNINVGCPSPKACRNQFGARLMRTPDLVRQIVQSCSRRLTQIPVTVKCRIGCDNCDDYGKLVEFVEHCRSGGASHIIVHARTCILNGLTPARNRTIPPLHYTHVHRLVKTFPEMTFCINGGIATFEDAFAHIQTPQTFQSETDDGLPTSHPWFAGDWDTFQKPSDKNLEDVMGPVHSVMMGRAAWHNPWLFRKADSVFFNTPDPEFSRREIIEGFFGYAREVNEQHLGRGEDPVPMHLLLRPLQYLVAGNRGTKAFRRKTGELYEMRGKTKGLGFEDIVRECMELLPSEVLDQRPSDPDLPHVFDRDEGAKYEDE